MQRCHESNASLALFRSAAGGAQLASNAAHTPVQEQHQVQYYLICLCLVDTFSCGARMKKIMPWRASYQLSWRRGHLHERVRHDLTRLRSLSPAVTTGRFGMIRDRVSHAMRAP
nr:unnamed protein product [Digitaria exilis]